MLKKLLVFSSVVMAAILFTACQANVKKESDMQVEKKVSQQQTAEDNKKEDNKQEAKTSIEIEDAHGKISVPLKPERVVALDNRTFETLEKWGVKLVASPKPLLPSGSSYLKDESILDVGGHNEPKLEQIAKANPDLVIVGQRFARQYEAIKKLVPEAKVIDLNIDLSKKVTNHGERLQKGLKDSTITLGKIFGKEKEADELVKAFDNAISENKKAYDKNKKVLSLIVSGGKIGFSAPGNGRFFGPLYEILGLTPSFESQESSTNHKGDEISLEAIAGNNPDYILVLDRDAAISKKKKESKPAKDVIENSETLKKTTAITNNKVLYAPLDTYINESIGTYTEFINDMTKLFKN